MATQVPKPSAKRQRLAAQAEQRANEELSSSGLLNATMSSVLVQFQSGQDDSFLGPTLSLPAGAGQAEMAKLVNELRRQLRQKEKRDDEDDEDVPYTFHVLLNKADAPTSQPTRININTSIHDDVLTSSVAKQLGISAEDSLTIVFEPQAVFRVRAVTRCSSTLAGHGSPILCCAFSPSGQLLATGAGDKVCRLWDMDTETPMHTLQGHDGWVLCVEWEPRERKLATGGMDGQVWIWDALTPPLPGRRGWGSRSSEQVEAEQQSAQAPGSAPQKMTVAQRRAARHAAPRGHMLRGHTKWITSLSWEPIHRDARSPRLASSSKDGTVRVWNVDARQVDFVLGGHTASVNAVRWGGDGAIYTASSDRTIKVWNDQDGRLIRTLNEHSHWVNSLTLSTDYVLRTGPFDVQGHYLASLLKNPDADQDAAAAAAALERYAEATANGAHAEMLVSASDDHTLFMWPPQIGGTSATPKKSIARLTGHQKTVNHVSFSPDGRMLASASFDNSVKLWDGRTGKFIANLRGHVASVYRVAWSSDSRMLASASKDSTIKLWNLKTFKIKVDLPGHEDEVYCVDFLADKLASGGRDRNVKIWRY
ncbi:rsa4-wd-repeat protein involved in ribosome biogenesis [Malassezia pachydermatis]|uniref:Rsa4-wd-repeat protein involved in ribosome biogenesis n=1 Tax=Malassezia pachydermatis TaxID=77020 RepID=A0A0M9VQ08_9BASI|nr:rsa4-wd-repeat protein involved in ribosome biogenesis [Malassezia pachydermatis]KOS15013.1 rsa4-wd-repeat protein involved in ribosome biogenesis [Malassezia pachydermatis]